MVIDQIFGTIAGVFFGNALSVWFFYAIFWGESQRKKGIPEERFPPWFFIGGSVPPLVASWCVYVAVY